MRITVMLSFLALLAGAQHVLADDATADEANIAEGKAIAFDRGRGNCLACHVIVGGDLAGNYGPPLLLMKVRYPNRADLRSKIWDASVKEPTTRMPPYGRHRILTEEQIDRVVDFIHTL